VSRYLRSVAGEAGTLLVLDDLHWAGADALDLLAALVTSPHTPPVRVIGAYRDTDPTGGALQTLIADLARASLVEVLPLGPLSDTDAEQLLADLVRADDERRRTVFPAIARRAGGVPFFLVSYAEALRLQTGSDAQVELPWKVSVVIRNRVTTLPEAVQELLRFAAVIGRIVPLQLLCRVAGLTEDETLTRMEIAAASRLLDEDDGAAYRFRHDLIRETIEGNLSPARRRLLHRRIGAALERDPRAPAETLAFHFGFSDDHERAIYYLELAGDQAAQQLAHAAAAEFYRQAADYMEQSDRTEDAAALQEKLGMALYRADHYDGAIAALERALQSYRAAGEDEAVDRVTGEIADAHFRRGTDHASVAPLTRLVDEGDLDAETGNAGSSGGIALREGLIRLLFARGSYKQMLTIGRSLTRVGRVTRNGRLQTMGQRVEGAALIFLGQLAEGAVLIEATIPAVLTIEEDPRVVDVASVLILLR
jgi:predicted ATPase